MDIHFNRVTIIGVGLIGGSLGLVLKQRHAAGFIVGVGRGIDNLKKAVEKGIIDRYTTDLKQGVEDSDLVVLATPVCAIIDIAKEIAPYLKKGAMVMDVGSVKGRIVGEMESVMPDGVFFVGAHPIAGTENSGAESAFPTLFRDSRCIITPTPHTNRDSLDKARHIWEIAGSHVVLMDPDRHDMICAAISHLPHIVAYTLVNAVSEIGDEELLEYSAGGFRDFTRVASSPADMWRDICLLNREQILDMIRLYEDRLRDIRSMIEMRNGEGLLREFENAREIKERLVKQM